MTSTNDVKMDGINNLSYNDKKDIKNQITYFKDEIFSYSALSYSELYLITMKNDDDPIDYKLKDKEGFKNAVTERYDKIVTIINNASSKSNDETEENDPSDSGSFGEGMFTSIIQFISLIIIGLMFAKMKWSNLIKPSKLNSKGGFNIFQFMGIVLFIFGFNHVFYNFLQIMKTNTNISVDNDDITNIKNKMNDIKSASDKNIDKKIQEFLKANFDVVKKEPTYNIKLTKYIDSFLRKQEKFMMKSENIGMKNSVFKKKVATSLNFFTGKNTIQLAKEYIKSNDDFKSVRDSKFATKMQTFRYIDDEQLTSDLKSKTYNNIFNSEGNDGILLNNLISLVTILNVNEPGIEDVFEYVIKINKYLAILEHMGLPEYRVLKFELIFKNTPELLTFFDKKDRYGFKDEIDVVLRLKANFEDCGDKNISAQSVYVNDVCSQYGN